MRCGKYREGVILNESRMKMAVFMEDRKIQLTEWEGPDGCISTKRVAVEKMQVGFCYRTKPAGEWDSGWRFMAGDERVHGQTGKLWHLQTHHHRFHRSRRPPAPESPLRLCLRA